MSQDIREFAAAPCDLLAFGEPTHQEPAFGRVRNDLFAQLAGHGFRSIAIETDRVAALAVDDFVREGAGTLDTAMSEGFSHGSGDLDANRRLVAWMREHNQNRPPEERVAFHGFDAPTEMVSAPSPRCYLEHARRYLGFAVDLTSLLGDDQRWSRTEAVMDPAMSVGATADAERLRSIADDMLTSLYARAPELIAATSRAEWFRARTHLTAGLGLLRYHKQSAQRIEQTARVSGQLAVRDAIMAQNLLDVRDSEARRGATFVFAHNRHLQRSLSNLRLGDLDLNWFGAGAIVGSLLGERYAFVAGSLGRSEALGLRDPDPDTYEGFLQRDTTTWGLTAATAITSARTRTDTTPEQGYFPLDQATLHAADAVLHISDGMASRSGVRLPAHEGEA
ncbi:erythromycin esterase family protein [Saccharopolyspora erythraea]|uniref:erythromycin esterase family protein n=1 Tax=Saccharopolyspora erythraea TaxID=1836 RepID=UPI001BA575C2|nr:erythromycin esterase family protein [Saccharopolyspora erythraea]QUH06238.1 erythromycin esterase family protein [Saccharopolyspora erythraea]